MTKRTPRNLRAPTVLWPTWRQSSSSLAWRSEWSTPRRSERQSTTVASWATFLSRPLSFGTTLRRRLVLGRGAGAASPTACTSSFHGSGSVCTRGYRLTATCSRRADAAFCWSMELARTAASIRPTAPRRSPKRACWTRRTTRLPRPGRLRTASLAELRRMRRASSRKRSSTRRRSRPPLLASPCAVGWRRGKAPAQPTSWMNTTATTQATMRTTKATTTKTKMARLTKRMKVAMAMTMESRRTRISCFWPE